jgi:NADPH2:quinone reductase
MRKMIGYLAEGAIRPSIFKRFKLSEVRAAHELLDSGAAFGKIVMTPE